MHFLLGIHSAEKTLELYPSFLKLGDIILPLTYIVGVRFGEDDEGLSFFDKLWYAE